ncbi:hypothetical protein [Streptomyces sp. NPDC008265]|uniref:hypothetical protein n=1 Tax=Streptomyces sp. NPDC008265 TaxID=3364824 RepID=UPI0036F120FF
MDTYAHGYGLTGHYRRPGMPYLSYCGRDLLPEPNTAIAARVCQPCAKAEARDRAAAEQVAADRAIDGPTLAERAGVRYCEVGTGRRVHFSPSTDDTLCGREVREYTDGPTGEQQLCARCINAAEQRAYTRALTAAPAAEAPVETAPADVIRLAVRAFRRAGSCITETITTLHTNCSCKIGRTLVGTYSTTAEADAAATVAARDTGRDVTHCIGSRPLHGTPDAAEAAAMAAVVRAVDAVEHAEETDAAVATVEEAEALYAAALVTEAEADEGTWRGEWIGEQQAADVLFAVAGPVEQGALFTAPPHAS